MNNPLFDMSPYQSQATQSYRTDWIDATETDPAWDEPEFYPDLEDNMVEPNSSAEESSKEVPNVAEEEKPEPKPLQVEVVEELSPEEEELRQQLELRVDKALYSAGCALKELRDRRLYRSTHKSWQEYCRQRFGYGRDSADLRILAAEVVENLEDKVPTNRRQILPTKLEQIRPLTKLKPDEQRSVWSEAVREAGGVPTGRIVKDAVLRYKGIVDGLKKKNPSPLEFTQGDVIEIKATKRSLTSCTS